MRSFIGWVKQEEFLNSLVDNTAPLSAMLDLVLATPSPATSTGPTVASSFMENSRYIQCTNVHRCISPGPMVILNRPICIINVVLLGSRVGNIVFMGLPYVYSVLLHGAGIF